MPASGPVRIALFDVSGRVAAEIVAEFVEAGVHTVDVDLGRHRRVKAGVYFVGMMANGTRRTQKLVVLR